MKNLTIISGVAGMTGSLVADRLLERGHIVVGFDNFFAGSRDVVNNLISKNNFHFFEYDIANSTNMNSLFSFIESMCSMKQHEVSFVNCAAVVHTKHFYHPNDTFETNVVAMRDSLARAIHMGISTFINCSTSEVYSMESWREGGVCENSPVLFSTAEQSLRTSYAAGKLLTEYFMRDAVERGDIKGCSVRFANVYSPSEAHEEHVIPYIITSLMREAKVVLLENGKDAYRSFLHNSDSCDAVIRLLDTPTVLDGSVYNVGTTEEIPIVDLVYKIAKMIGRSEVVIEYRGWRSADPPRRLLNINKIYKATGWMPKISLDQGLRECIHFREKGDES